MNIKANSRDDQADFKLPNNKSVGFVTTIGNTKTSVFAAHRVMFSLSNFRRHGLGDVYHTGPKSIGIGTRLVFDLFLLASLQL